MKRTQA